MAVKQRIGLYFGSFNPIHEGHIHVAKTALKASIDKLYLVVSPQSPFKPLTELAPFKDRLEMARLAIKSHNLESRVEVVDWEERMFPSYTAETLRKAVPVLQESEVTIFMGLDNFLTIERWREPKFILENYNIFIIPRGDDCVKTISTKIDELNKTVTSKLRNISYSNPKKVVHISATDIRKKLIAKEDVSNIISFAVLNYIQQNGLYGVEHKEISIPDELLIWLQQEWRRSNMNKYQSLFAKWVNNITQPQVEGFMIQMYRYKNNVLGKTTKG